jgi:two-component system NtrC family sensor kinase
METNDIRVLLIEDDEDDYVLIEDLLSSVPGKKFNLVWTDDYDTGIEAIGACQHDVCLLDYRLGERSGLDLLRQAVGNDCEIPVIVLTGQDDQTVDLEAMRIGASDYLVKGQIDSTMLDRSIRYAISHKQMESHILESNRLASIGKLAAGMAHEINNPLTTVLGLSQLLMAKNLPESIFEDLTIISSEAQRAAKIVKNLLLFARKTGPEMSYLDVASILHRAQELKSSDFKANNIMVINDVPQTLPLTMVDEQQLMQVFINILTNAEQECFESHGGGQLCLKATTSPDWIKISISDDGPGISPDNFDVIFEPFYSTKDVGRGTGLGLSICYGIVRQHGGELWAESEPGNGATFHVQLPIVVQEATTPALEEETVPALSKHLLVVDDEPQIGNLLVRYLEMEHYTVDLADGGADAVRKLTSTGYDCILLDLKMPGMSGKELFHHIEASDQKAAEKVIFITGDTSDRHTHEFITGLNNPVILKPFQLDDIRRQVQKMVEAN